MKCVGGIVVVTNQPVKDFNGHRDVQGTGLQSTHIYKKEL